MTGSSCEVSTFSFSSSGTGRIEIIIVFENGVGVHGDYTLLLDGAVVRTFDPGGSLVYEGVGEGDHAVRLLGIPPHCVLEGENPRPVTVRPNDTSMIQFSITCDT